MDTFNTATYNTGLGTAFTISACPDYNPNVFGPKTGYAIEKKIVYLSGAMAGMPGRNFELFKKCADGWRAAGWTVVNPAENFGGCDKPTRFQRLKQDYVSLVTSCEAIAMIPGWEKSEGAMVEFMIAKSLGYPVYDATHVGMLLNYNIKPAEINKADERYFKQKETTRELLKLDPAPEVDNDVLAATIQKAIDEQQSQTVNRAEVIRERVEAMTGPRQPESCCAIADRVVSTDRGEDYGHPRDDFRKVAEMANAIGWRVEHTNPRGQKFYRPLREEDHAIYMQFVKISREVHKHKRDNLVDGAGYWKTLDMIHGMK